MDVVAGGARYLEFDKIEPGSVLDEWDETRREKIRVEVAMVTVLRRLRQPVEGAVGYGGGVILNDRLFLFRQARIRTSTRKRSEHRNTEWVVCREYDEGEVFGNWDDAMNSLIPRHLVETSHGL